MHGWEGLIRPFFWCLERFYTDLEDLRTVILRSRCSQMLYKTDTEIYFQKSRRLEDGNFIQETPAHEFEWNVWEHLLCITPVNDCLLLLFFAKFKGNTRNKILLTVKFTKSSPPLQVFSWQFYEVFQNSFHTTPVGDMCDLLMDIRHYRVKLIITSIFLQPFREPIRKYIEHYF